MVKKFLCVKCNARHWYRPAKCCRCGHSELIEEEIKVPRVIGGQPAIQRIEAKRDGRLF